MGFKEKKPLISITLLVLLVFLLIGAVSADNISDTGTVDSNTNSIDEITTNDLSNSTIELSENENTSTIYISPNGTGTGSSLNDTANWTTAYENSTNNGTYNIYKWNI